MKSKITVSILVLLFATGGNAGPIHCSDAHHKFIALRDLPKIQDRSVFMLENSSPPRFSDIQYLRVHPSGRYVIISLETGEARIIDLTDMANPKTIKTPLVAEAYPLEPSWDYISSPKMPEVMEYYSFDDLLKKGVKGQKSEPLFYDKTHKEFYQSLAEYPDSKAGNRHFKTLLFSSTKSKNYRIIVKPDGKYESIPPQNDESVKSREGVLCANISTQFTTPILSKDGQFLGVSHSDERLKPGDIPQKKSTTRIYKINLDKSCELDEDFKYDTGKISFSYPQKDKKGAVTFTSLSTVEKINGDTLQTNAVYFYDRDKKELKMISRPWKEEDTSYPGFTRDGRIIYTAKRNGQGGLVIVDPKKVSPPPAPDEADDPYKVCYSTSATKKTESKHKGSAQ